MNNREAMNTNRQARLDALAESYDRQIDALLRNDFEEYKYLVGHTQEDSKTQDVDSHYQAWSCGTFYRTSIFSNLPGCYFCASQAEYADTEYPYDEKAQDMHKKIVANKVISLPDFDSGEQLPDGRFTEAQLLEFKRRQLAARGYFTEKTS